MLMAAPGSGLPWTDRLRLGVGIALAILAAQTVLSWVALAALAALLLSRNGWVWVPAAATVLLATVINSLKWPDSDLAEYYAYLDLARTQSVWALLKDEDIFVSIKPTEPLFRALAGLCAHATPSPRIFFSLVCGLVTYGAALAMCRMTTRAWTTANAVATPAAASACAAALLLGITFSLVGHLVRQYLAGAIFFLGFFGYLTSGRKQWLLLPLLAGGIHNGALMLLAPLLLSLLLHARPKLLLTLLAAFLAAAELQQIPLLSELATDLSFLKQDGEIGYLLPTLDAGVLVLAWWVWRRTPVSQRPFDDRSMARILWFGMTLGVMLFSVREVSLLLFRSYFFFEFLRVPMLAFVLCAWLRSADAARHALQAMLLACAVTVCWLRAHGSEWVYTSGTTTWPDWADIHHTFERWRSIEGARL